MSSSKNDDLDLPEGWVLCTSKSKTGRKYYFNRKTGKSSWTKPQKEDATPSKNASKKKKERDKQMKRQDAAKTSVKRKSDGCSSVGDSKKRKADTSRNKPSTNKLPSNNKRKVLSPHKAIPSQKARESPSPAKKTDTPASRSSPLASTPAKNKANARLSLLRTELAEEVKRESISPKPKSAPPTPQPEKPKETLNESQTSQASNESLHSIPSPSQFFAANKILSSMKAQLPEKSDDKQKQKDTFADIEQGICNQTADSLMKPPVTPPQFSEATKLMSAIKSKLYQTKESPVKCSSASDRLASLRTSLNSDMESNFDIEIQDTREAMDIDVKSIPLPPSVAMNTSTSGSKDNLILVVDTNVFIHELDLIKNVMNSYVEGYKEQPTLLVPWRVINELDQLKDNNLGRGAVCRRARPAMDYLYKCLPHNHRIKVQPLRDANSHIYPCESPDDEILNCCLQQADRGNSVMLVSNDKNLCIKSMSNGVAGVAPRALRLRRPPADRALAARPAALMHTLITTILEHEMRAKYGALWLHVVARPPPWSLSGALGSVARHWPAVFSEVFPRIRPLISDLKSSWDTIDGKDPSSLTQAEVQNFKELCLEIAQRCQIIPEYMELAKKTVSKLQSETDVASDEEREEDGDKTVIEAFERVWTVYSSYCAKLASELGVTHNLEDRLSVVDPLEVLVNKLTEFGTKITLLTGAMEGVLNNESSQDNPEPVARLEAAFKDSMATVGVDTSSINHHKIKLFCTKCRNMLQEAQMKFSQLLSVLEQCRTRISNC